MNGKRQRKNKEIWEKASAETVETIKLEVTAKCEGAGLDRPVKEIANLALKAGGRGAMGLDMREGPRCGDTLHPLGSTHHVKKCNGTRRNYNIVMRSKVCNVCGTSMSRESMPKHEAMCRARLEALNPPKLVKKRITKKKTAPVHAEVVLRMEPVVARPNKRQKRGGMMAKRDTVRREKKRTALDGRSFECKYCGGSF